MTTLEIAGTTRTTVTLRWDVNPDVQAYQLWRGVLPADADERIAILGGPTFIDPNCQPGINYIYRIETMGLAPDEESTVRARTEPATEYPGHVEFFNQYLAATFAREMEGGIYKWCPRWNIHPEASEVVIDLWRSYEAHRPPDDSGAPSNHHVEWRTFFAYPLMTRLMDPTGCFKYCYAHQHQSVVPSLPSPQ